MVLAFPLTLHPGGVVMSPGVDTNLFMWTLAWDAHAIIHSPLAIFQANTFYPFANSLAFSENLLGSSIIAAPILWFGGGPVLAMNIVAIASIPLSALGAFVLARQLGATRAAAVLAGVVFGFAPPRFFRLDQLHLTTVQWLPFCLASAHAYLQRGHARDLRIAVACFTAQALTSGHAAVFLATALIALSVHAAVSGVPLSLGRRLRDLGLVGAILLIPSALILLPYRHAQEEVDILRTLADYRVVSWQSFVASPSYVHRWIVDTFTPGSHIISLAGAYLFPGILPLALAAIALAPRRHSVPRDAHAIASFLELLTVGVIAVALWATLRAPLRWRIGDVTLITIRSASRAWLVTLALLAARAALLRRSPFQPAGSVRRAFQALRRVRTSAHPNVAIFYGLLTTLCVWLSAPPPLGLWPHVYWLPGFSYIRAPSRFMILGVLGLAVLAAIGFDRATHRLARRLRAPCVVALIGLMLAEFAAAPLGVTTDTGDIPAIDRWLASRPDLRVIAEAPVIAAVSEHDLQQSQYMLHSMAHWHKTVHGYSGVYPPLTIGLYEHLIHFPDDETIRALKSVHVDTVVVHMDGYPSAARADIEQRLSAQPALHLEHVEGDGRVYSVR